MQGRMISLRYPLTALNLWLLTLSHTQSQNLTKLNDSEPGPSINPHSQKNMDFWTLALYQTSHQFYYLYDKQVCVILYKPSINFTGTLGSTIKWNSSASTYICRWLCYRLVLWLILYNQNFLERLNTIRF